MPTPTGASLLPAPDTADAALTQRLRAALAAKGPAYRPRTHHLLADGTPKYLNRLILETSPYLLQHAHNPVNWHPWGDEAFERARREGKPVFVSIGYSTCHWCHVMERESFEDEEVAALINANFIAIKVDREERPDVDDLYMKAVQVLTGRGGWPMTVMLTPDKAPFFGGTYFPARDGDRGARKGFMTILRELRAEYDTNRAGLLAHAKELSQRMEQLSTPSPPGDVPTAALITQLAQGLRGSYDPIQGGFGRAPKFPRPVMLELLLRHHRRTGDAQALAMVRHTLESMANGGINDQVGGGFHRYSTDAQWLVPHFEKMLYDNAQLVPVYLDAFQLTQHTPFAGVVRQTLRYVGREMTAPGGAFYSATDADSPTPAGHEDEGYYFTWTPAELREVLGDEAARVVSAWYRVTAQGNFEGRNILSTPRPEAPVAAELGVTLDVLRSTVAQAREALYAARSKRPPPLRDDKILASWNGLMISAFARAALVLGDADYAARAAAAANFVLEALRSPAGTLRRSYKDGQTSSDGFLDDYAFVIQGLLDLFEADAQPAWLDEALTLQATLDAGFWDEAHGGYFTSSNTHERLLVRDKPSYDGAEPSGNAVAAMNLLRLAELTSNDAHQKRAERLLAAFATELRGSPGASPKLLSALDALLSSSLEVFVVSPPGTDPAPLMEAFRAVYLPNRVLVTAVEGPALAALTSRIPALDGKRALNGAPTAFVCERGLCKRPTTDPATFTAELMRPDGP